MKKMILAVLVAGFAYLALASPASAQAGDLVFCGPTVGYAAVCPDDVVAPDVTPDVVDPDVGATTVGTLPRTGSDSSLPLARAAIVLIGVGGALTVIARRRRVQPIAG